MCAVEIEGNTIGISLLITQFPRTDSDTSSTEEHLQVDIEDLVITARCPDRLENTVCKASNREIVCTMRELVVIITPWSWHAATYMFPFMHVESVLSVIVL